MLPDWFNSSALLLPPAEDTQPVINVSGGDAAAGFDISSLSTTADVLVRILNSPDISNRMVRRFNLMERFGANNLQEAGEELKDVVDIYKTEEGLLYISVEDKDPEFAAQMANGFIEELDSLTKSVARIQAREKVEFFKARLEIANSQLEQARSDFQKFQTENKAIDFEEQTHLSMERAVALKVELEQIDIEVQLAARNLRPKDLELSQMKSRGDVIRERLKEIEYGGKESSFLSMPLNSIPMLRGKFEAFASKVKVAETLTSVLQQQMEQAKIQEAGLVEYSVLQYAQVSEMPSKPDRVILLIIAYMVSLAAAVFLAILLQYFNFLAERSPADHHRAMMFVRAYLGWLPGVSKKKD